MKIFIIPILSVLTALQCFAQSSEKLIVDDTAKQIFSSTELKGIEEMILFVDSVISDNTNEGEINQAYYTYFDKCASYIKEGIIFPSLLKDSIKFKYMEAMDKGAFDAIWRMDDYVRMVKYKDTIFVDLHDFKTLGFNLQGNYQKYLKEIGKTDKRYAEINETIEASGDVSPSLFSWFPMHHHEFDFTLFKDRFWASVFLLRSVDPLEERMERYLKEKTH